MKTNEINNRLNAIQTYFAGKGWNCSIERVSHDVIGVYCYDYTGQPAMGVFTKGNSGIFEPAGYNAHYKRGANRAIEATA